MSVHPIRSSLSVPSPPCSLLFSRCSGLRSECPAICVGEQRRAEHPGNDQWAVSQILGDYQCTEWDHKPDGVWWEFELNELCVCVCVCDCTFIFSFLVVVVSFFGCVFACEVAFAHAFTHIFARAYVSVGGKEKNRLWCFRGHAYGGLAVIHSCG